MIYAYVNGSEIIAPMSLHQHLRRFKDFVDADEATKMAHGYYPCDIVCPAFDAGYQEPVLESKTFENNRVTVKYNVVNTLTLDEFKAEKKRKVNQRRDAILSGTFMIPESNNTLQMRDSDKINWLALRTRAADNPAETFTIRTTDNKNLEYSGEAIVDILDAMTAYCSAIMEYSWELKDSIDALESFEAVASVSVSDGWPI